MLTRDELICELVKIRSVTADIPEVNNCVEYLRDQLAGEGFFCAVETFDGGRKALWASNIDGKKPDLTIVVHLDVVPVDSDTQFEPRIEGDKIIGRGTGDCKGNAVAAILALREIAADKSGRASIGVIFATDEEHGGSTTAGMVERGYGAKKAALVYDSYSESSLCVAHKGILTLEITANSVGGHSSIPWCFKNPIDLLMDALVKLRAHWDAKYPHVDGQEWHNTCAVTMFNAGKAFNQIPDAATATLNIRFIETATPESLTEEVKSVTGLDCRICDISPCVSFPADSAEVQLLGKIVAKSYGVSETKYIKGNGATDARHLGPLGVPVAVTGIEEHGIHQSNETASLSSMTRYGAIAAEFARELAKM